MIKGLFTSPAQQAPPARPEQPAEELDAEQTSPARPTPHPDHPEWPEGETAPRVFQRLDGWTPGTLPPPTPGDPLDLLPERLRSHEELWHALRVWEQQQRRLDAAAVAMHRRQAAEEQRREQLTAAEEAEEQAEQDAEARRKALTAEISRRAAEVGLHPEETTEYNRTWKTSRPVYRLTAPNMDHPALAPAHPWEPRRAPLRVRSGFIVAQAESLDGLREWLDQNAARLLDADRA